MSKSQSGPGITVPSRRDFLKQSSAVVGAGLAAGLVTPGGVHAGADETIRIGLIGCGGRGTGAASQALHTKGPVKLVAMADAFDDRLEGSLANLQKDDDIAERIDVPAERRFVGFDAYKDVLDAGVDMVILATPPGFRPIHFAAAVDANKHVFMEKPVAVDGPGIRKVLEAAQAAKQKSLAVGVGLQRHHQPPYLETIQRLKDGAIGDIVAQRVYWNGAGVWVRKRQEGQTEMEYQMRNWYYFNWLCGDHICEQHIHNLDVSNWLKGDHPTKCWGMGGREVRDGIDNGEIFDHFAVEYEYGDGSRTFSQCRHIPGCWSSVSEHAIGSNGTADISGAKISANGADRWRYRGETPNPYQVEHDDLFAAIRSGASYNEAEYGAHSTLTSIMGRMATYSGKPVTWDEALNSEIDLSPAKYAFDAEAPRVQIAVPGQTVAV
jgi:myo-inositol 2-dehydrogenase/D-chiro-inositol 1-dehydrogenase